ncbi:hypothetical protein BP6252_07484 [Coleophoma cylindrospora]|uniref:Peptidase S53 domain-containing protein n=1 Tax=Coleophoma cylindrospora TaxID=1849047 RepID=A0A3D8RHQ8_9HELO|nr:hypothetical protein BP6252_07484 [Coleophoma cylindrospora]
MRDLKLLVAISIFASVRAAPYSPYAVHAKRDTSLASNWIESTEKVHSNAIIPLAVALTQQNLENGYDFLMDVSDPTSQNYGKHWSLEKIAETFAATDEAIEDVFSWLSGNGISENRTILSASKTWIRVNVTVAEAETLLKTEYKLYNHVHTRKRSLAVEQYSVPAAIKRHIDFISPTILSSSTLKRMNSKRHGSVESDPVFASFPNPPAPEKPDYAALQTGGSKVVATNPWAWDLSYCAYQFITPACIRKLYNAPNGTLDLSSYAVVEYYTEYYNQTDLSTYLYNMNPVAPSDTFPTMYVAPDAVYPTNFTGDDDVEGNLDIQLATAIVYPQTMSYYQLNDDDVFLDAVDASYCQLTGSTGGCGVMPLTDVVSTSWGYSEDQVDDERIRECNEYMKLGLNGKTLLWSSGDNGVGCTATNGFQATWPSVCPYVTSVGATQIPKGGSVSDGEVATFGFSSGGGFSSYYPAPAYQAATIAHYWQHYNPNISAVYFNTSITNRGYPDVAANGAYAAIVVGGEWQLWGGTSQSCPTFGGIITLINEQRLAAGKSTVGFINPVIYANPNAMNDITSGNNPGCLDYGFSAVKGWDPVTGLGTPDYKKLLNVWMRLP